MHTEDVFNRWNVPREALREFVNIYIYRKIKDLRWKPLSEIKKR